MNSKIKISEIFQSLQGEGKFVGYPMLFIRTSGCTRNPPCTFCDTKYHKKGIEMTSERIIEIIRDSQLDIVCWSGGEPLLQRKKIYEIMNEVNRICNKEWHLETNGDLLHYDELERFDYIACSPKTVEVAQNVSELLKVIKNTSLENRLDIKVVTDLKMGMDMLQYATIVMPLSTYKRKDKKINQKVWEYCVKNNIRFSPRLQTLIFGKKRAV